MSPKLHKQPYPSTQAIKKQQHQCPCQCQLCIITGLSSVKEEVVVVGEETDDAGGVVGGGANNLHAVSSLEVGLDQLVVFPIAERQRFEVRAPQHATHHFVSDDTIHHHSASETGGTGTATCNASFC